MATRTTQELDAIGGDAFDVDGSRLRLIVDGGDRLEALLAVIASAEHDLRLIYYIFAGDDAGTQVRDALIDARKRGVTVSLLVDGFGSEDTVDGFFAPLRDAGASVCRFLPRFGRRYLLRNHQKMALADETRVLIGGFNIEDSYFAPVGARGWRDLGLLVEGPAAAHLAGYFDALIGWTREPKATVLGLNRLLGGWSQKRGGPVRWLFGGPSRRPNPWAHALKRDIARARRLDVVAAYFAPNPGTLRRIGRLARRGRLRIVTAALSDNTMTVAAARNSYARLLRRGAAIFEYQATRLHAKLFVADDIAYLGSANFDMRSLYINCEIMLRVEDAAFAAALRRHIDGEVAASREASLEGIRERTGWLTRLKWRIAYYLVAIVDYGVTRRLNFDRIGSATDIGAGDGG